MGGLSCGWVIGIVVTFTVVVFVLPAIASWIEGR
jgi:hypothetical protein